MARCRLSAAVVISATLLAACGEGETAVVAAPSSTTTLAGPDRITTTTVAAVTSPSSTSSTTTALRWSLPITFTLGIDDDGLRLRLRPGDEVVPRLPVAAVADAGWNLLVAPDPAVLRGGDDLLWRPSETDDGRLEITSRGSGQLTVGTASLMPADNILGWRADTVALVEALGSPVYRWPGGNFVSGYDW